MEPKTIKIIVITGIGLALAVTIFIILKKKGVISKTIVDYDKEIAKLFVVINALTQADRDAKMTGSELSPAERAKALILMMTHSKDKTKVSQAEKEELYRYLRRVFGGSVNASGDATGKGARSWHIPLFYPRPTN